VRYFKAVFPTLCATALLVLYIFLLYNQFSDGLPWFGFIGYGVFVGYSFKKNIEPLMFESRKMQLIILILCIVALVACVVAAIVIYTIAENRMWADILKTKG